MKQNPETVRTVNTRDTVITNITDTIRATIIRVSRKAIKHD